MKCTRYFESMRSRPDRQTIRDEWIELVVSTPDRQEVQSDGRHRRWARINDAGGEYLRVILLADGETVHNAFFDRTYKP